MKRKEKALQEAGGFSGRKLTPSEKGKTRKLPNEEGGELDEKKTYHVWKNKVKKKQGGGEFEMGTCINGKQQCLEVCQTKMPKIRNGTIANEKELARGHKVRRISTFHGKKQTLIGSQERLPHKCRQWGYTGWKRKKKSH